MISIRVDDREFRKALQEFKEFNHRALVDITNKTAWEVAYKANKLTSITPKEQIKSELMDTVKGNTPLASLIVNKQQAKKGLKGLVGRKMQTAVTKLINQRRKASRFVSLGWAAARNAMAPYVKGKRPMGRVKSSLGGAIPAKNVNNRASAMIYNNVMGGKRDGSKPSKVTQVAYEGLQKAINWKTADMIDYVKREMNKGIERFNRHR